MSSSGTWTLADKQRLAVALTEWHRRHPRSGTASAITSLSFRDWVQRVRPSYRWYRHCAALAEVLQRLADGELRRLMIFCPPRHGKSEAVSRLFSAYYLYRHPGRWVGLASYAAELAYTLSRAARDHYRESGGKIRDDAEAVKHWETTQGGGLWAAGVGGPITGKGFHLGIIDDPLKNAEEAGSETIRLKQQDWYSSTFYTREEPAPSAIVIISTRWHESDLCGWLLEEEKGDSPEGWHVVNLPAIAGGELHLPPSCTREEDWRSPGEALCPERYDVERLQRIKDRIGLYWFSSLYDQQPTPQQGLLFTRAGLSHFVGDVPLSVTRVRYWDKSAAAPGKGDFTCGVLLARDEDGLFYVEDVVRGQWPAHERNAIIVQTAELDRQRGRVTIYVEQPPGLAKESTDTVIRLLAGYYARPDPVMKDKVERAEPLAAQVNAGNVRLVRGNWDARAFVEELAAFPAGAHDDQVDSASGAFNKLVRRFSIGDGAL